MALVALSCVIACGEVDPPHDSICQPPEDLAPQECVLHRAEVEGRFTAETLRTEVCQRGCAQAVGELRVEDMEEMGDLRAFGHLREVHGSLIIRSNPDLRTLTGLEDLRAVYGDLIIESNPRLRSLRGLEALEQVSGELRIVYNPEIEALPPLPRLQAVGRLTIRDNERLSQCQVDALLERLGVSDAARLRSRPNADDSSPCAP